MQHLLKKNGSYLCDVMNEGHVYVCGDVTMAAEVQKTLEDILQKHNIISQIEASEQVLKLRVGDDCRETKPANQDKMGDLYCLTVKRHTVHT